jgi:hypothetical protein
MTEVIESEMLDEVETHEAANQREPRKKKPDHAEGMHLGGISLKLELHAGHGRNNRRHRTAALRANRLTCD